MSNYRHKSVMVRQVIAALNVKPGGKFADGTTGGGGHAAAILAASSPNGWVFGCDRDGDAVEAARERLAEFAGRFEIRQGNYADLAEMLPGNSCDGIILDLGTSSHQLDTAQRGFSVMQDGPLDMRFDARQETTAADLVNGLSADELAKIFWELGDEPDSRRIARAIEMDRRQQRFTTTGQLAELIERLNPRRGKKTHPATLVFQALRLAVNEELSSLKRGLDAALKVLKPGGRLAVLSFHSIEDRIVKNFARERSREYAVDGPVDVPELRRARTPELRWVQRKAEKPDSEELAENPRSRSAQLRIMEKV